MWYINPEKTKIYNLFHFTDIYSHDSNNGNYYIILDRPHMRYVEIDFLDKESRDKEFEKIMKMIKKENDEKNR